MRKGKPGPYLSKVYPQMRVNSALPICPIESSRETIKALTWRGMFLISRESIPTLYTYEEIMNTEAISFASYVWGPSMNLNINAPAPLTMQLHGMKI